MNKLDRDLTLILSPSKHLCKKNLILVDLSRLKSLDVVVQWGTFYLLIDDFLLHEI